MYPLYPFTDCPDERTPGVLLLDGDDEGKTTADRVGSRWRIVDWEAHETDGELYWFARSWHTISAEHVATLARATQA